MQFGYHKDAFYGRCIVAHIFEGTKDVFRALITKLEMTSQIYEPAPASVIWIAHQRIFQKFIRILQSASRILKEKYNFLTITLLTLNFPLIN